MFRRYSVVVSLILLAAASGAAADEEVGAVVASADVTKSDFPQDPIVFVHGCPVPAPLGSGTNYITSTYWWKMYEHFRDERDYPAMPWPTRIHEGIPVLDPQNGKEEPDPARLPGSSKEANGTGASTPTAPQQYLNILVHQDGQCGSHVDHAIALANYVKEVRKATGAKKVDIVANSMGALAARWYIKFLGGHRYVRDVALLAGTNHGTDVALVVEPFGPGPVDAVDGLGTPVDALRDPNYEGARQATPAYQCDDGGFQRRLNGCTPDGEVRDEDRLERIAENTHENRKKISWINLYNDVVDELHQPTATSCVNQQFRNDCSDRSVNVGLQNTDGEPHGDYRLNQQVIDATYAHVTSRRRELP